ncbi:hypothetical protein CASFOL_040335 [Castilleja foliolosa]|uniref:YABBY N-terminal domain-containing protein n=1 Tax=Castilleja foliolosa TaxID=1961234 RepID=A0ABD3BF61_9LAMI
MSIELPSERVCYVQCNYCNTILAAFSVVQVSVPQGSMFTIVTVRCGHCANLLSVNMGVLHHSLHLQDFQQTGMVTESNAAAAAIKDGVGVGSSSKLNRFGPLQTQYEQPKMPPVRRVDGQQKYDQNFQCCVPC